MDSEKTIQFILEHQAAFATDMEALKEMQRKTDDRINGLVLTAQAHQASLDSFDAKWRDLIGRFDGIDQRLNTLTSVAASLVLTAQAHQASLDAFDSKWKDFLARFDRWLRGQGGNGKS